MRSIIADRALLFSESSLIPPVRLDLIVRRHSTPSGAAMRQNEWAA
jgi:hypothetical protein